MLLDIDWVKPNIRTVRKQLEQVRNAPKKPNRLWCFTIIRARASERVRPVVARKLT